MNELKTGTTVRLADGTSAEVLSTLGQGAQGTVYKVRRGGREYALKWYHKDPSGAFYENLRNNASLPAPSPAFLWPKAVAERQEGSTGYLMDLIPAGYHPLSDFLLARVQFRTFGAILQAAIAICDAFRRLHLGGLSFQDINDGNIVIRPETGDVLIVDNDNISPNNTNFGIRGKSRYMAAEVIGGGRPNIESDLLSLAVILYRLFMIDHPFEGQMTLRIPCMTDEYEKKYYGLDAVFCQDLTNPVNRPHPDIHRNAVRRWAFIPQSLKDAFCRALGHEAITTPGSRLREKQWKDIFVGLRALLVVCPAAGKDGSHHDYLPGSIREAGTCPRCGAAVTTLTQLELDGSTYFLTPGKALYLEDSMTPVGICSVFSSPSGKEVGLKNASASSWTLITKNGKYRVIHPGEDCPLRKGMQICFTSRLTGNVS